MTIRRVARLLLIRFLKEWIRLAGLQVHVDVHNLRFRHFDNLTCAECFNVDVHRYGSPTQLDWGGQKTNNVSD